MKISLLILVFGLVALVSCSQYSGKSAAGSGSKDLAGEIDSVSYAIGADLANMVVMSNIKEVNTAAFVDGFTAVINNDTAKLKIKLANTRNLISAYIQKEQNKETEKNKKEGEAFLEANKKKPGVKVTPSGVQYIVLKEGNGPIASDTADVKVNYHGTLIDGTVFDSSVDRKEPLTISVKRVIKGWQDILKIMPVGSKWKIFVPEQLGYGANVRPGGKIKPSMALIFEIELLEIVPPKQAETPQDLKLKTLNPKGSK
jgi:FKBP-type peptidyl-prolyl cis-trans isomerase